MKLSDKQSIQHIVSTLAALGLREVIICPGSRNAPLVISFSRHPGFHCASVRDERSAGFYALGKALGLGEPVAIVCTSGSAALNFAPAISEAFYQRIPLIVITADRPKEWTNQGDGQTINQTNLYQNFIRKSYDLKGDAQTTSDFWYNERCLSEGYSIATGSDKGPVHFNIPLSEPLYNTGEINIKEPKVFRELTVEKTLPSVGLLKLREEFSATERVMIIAGQHAVDEKFQKGLSEVARFNNVIVLTESTSNVHDRYFIENIDRYISTLDENEARQLAPDLLITVGGAVVSKRIKALLRKHPPRSHWNVDPFDAFMDTYQSLTLAVPLHASQFLDQFNQGLEECASGYREKWIRRKDALEKLHQSFCEACAYSDYSVFRHIYSSMPDHLHVHLANSSPVRYAQLFDNQKLASSWSNRGTSGIDGCTSTAMGSASASPEKDFLLITGDVAFYYDINGLWNDEKINNLKIILINNSGGGIFRIISGPDKVAELEDYFETSMKSDAKNIAVHFQWDYLSAKDESSLESALKIFFQPATKRTILEIFTDAEKNPVVLDEYWKYLKEKSAAL